MDQTESIARWFALSSPFWNNAVVQMAPGRHHEAAPWRRWRSPRGDTSHSLIRAHPASNQSSVAAGWYKREYLARKRVTGRRVFFYIYVSLYIIHVSRIFFNIFHLSFNSLLIKISSAPFIIFSTFSCCYKVSLFTFHKVILITSHVLLNNLITCIILSRRALLLRCKIVNITRSNTHGLFTEIIFTE